MSKKSTKKALVMSVISLLACVSMLVGSTFAWFTDSVTTGMNTIAAGNLDVELLSDGVAVNATTKLFDDVTLWEPGVVVYENLQVSNEGTLALKYQMSLNFGNENDLNGHKLSEVLKIAVVDAIAAGASRADVLAAAKASANVGTLSDFVITDALEAGAKSAEQAVVIFWEPNSNDIDNLYNANNGQTTSDGLPLHIEFGVHLMATQYTYEEDSFDELYDELAIVSNAADLKAAIAAGQNVILNGDIAVDAPIAVADGAEAIIDLNGHTISRVDADADKNDDGKFTSADNTCIFQVKGNLTVQGEGSIVMEHTGANMEWNALSACFSVEAGELTLGEGVVVAHKGGTDMAYAVDVNTTLGETVLNVEGATLYSPYVGVRVFNNHKTAKGIVNYNSGIIAGDSRDIWTQIMSAPAENAVVNTEIPYSTNANGDRYYFDDAVTYVANAASLKDALAAGKDVVLLADIALDVADTGFTVGNGVSAKIDLNGHDIIATSDSSQSVQLFYVEGTLEIAGEGTISLNGDNFPWNSSYRYTAINIRENGEVTLGEGVNVVCEAGADSYGMSYAVDIYTTGVLNVNGASLHSNYIAVRCFFGNSVVNVNSGSITSSKNNWGIWPQSASGAQINVASGIAYTIDSYGIYSFG